jgi:hypothetical protein
VEDRIKHNAQLVISQMRPLSGFDFGYDAQSVAWLDGYIERQRIRDDMTPELLDSLVNILGSYLGQCVIICYGGYWQIEPAGQLRVSFNEDNAVYPLAKVQKQFQNGSEDSIKSFFETIPLVFATAGNRAGSEQKPWWRFW